jgi:hypothetical protein
MVIGILSITNIKVILFYTGISEREKNSTVYIWTTADIPLSFTVIVGSLDSRVPDL